MAFAQEQVGADNAALLPAVQQRPLRRPAEFVIALEHRRFWPVYIATWPANHR